MAQKHPDNAAYVSADGLVSFDRYGRKLDSLGHVVAGDYQSAGDAGASPIQRREEPKQQQYQGNPNIGAQMTRSPVAPRRSSWDNSPLPASSATSAPANRVRGSNPNVLEPGGIDPATGQPYPTARNGGLAQRRSAWRQPWMDQQVQSGYQAPQRQAGGNWRQMQSYVPPTPPPSEPIPFMADGLRSELAVYEPYQNATIPVTDPLYVYRQGVTSTGMPSFPQPAMGQTVYEPYSGASTPVTDPLYMYRQGVTYP